MPNGSHNVLAESIVEGPESHELRVVEPGVQGVVGEVVLVASFSSLWLGYLAVGLVGVGFVVAGILFYKRTRPGLDRTP